MATSGFRIVGHTAEVGLEIAGRNFPAFHRNAALGLLEIIRPEARPRRLKTVRLRLKADSAEELLVAWINEVVYLASTRRWLPVGFKLRSPSPTELLAEMRGGSLADGPDGKRIRLAAEVKAATFHDLHIRRARGLWRAKIILDV